MADLRTKLRQTSGSFGEPGYTLDRLDSLKRRRERASRFLAMAVAFAVVALSGSLLWGAFVGAPRGGRVPGGSFGVENGRISFIVGQLGGSMEGIQLATAEPDGSDQQTLIDGAPEYLTGGWSPDGSMIVFSRDPVDTPEGDIGIWKINADGSGLVQLTAGTADLDAQWSPDGTQILFRRPSNDGAPAIFVINADGSDLRRVSSDPSLVCLGARWSPDGSEILFIADTLADDGQEGLGIYVMRADGTDARRIYAGVNGTPQWSPDGDRILFQVNSRLVTMSPEGVDLRTVAEGFEVNGTSSYRWSPNGSRIFYTRAIGTGRGEQLRVVRVDGSMNRIVAEGLQWRDSSSTWSPDGRLIAFVRDGDIWTIDLESGAEQQVTDTPAYESLPAWGTG